MSDAEQPIEPAPLPPDAEQIGPLVFVPNPEYPYPFPVDTPPRFWMEESTGALSDAIDAYMSGERLTNEQLDLIKIYLTQYISRALLTPDAKKPLILSRIAKLKTRNDVERFADDVSDFGAEVF
jgi:hypothetical protein